MPVSLIATSHPFGSTGDFVYQTNLALTFSQPDLQTTYNGLTASGGNDTPEAQIEALMQR